jgi:hypothetical protein
LREQIPMKDRIVRNTKEMMVHEQAHFTCFPAASETARRLSFFRFATYPHGVKSVIMFTSQEALAKRLSRLFHLFGSVWCKI